jgi:hypothetical protein
MTLIMPEQFKICPDQAVRLTAIEEQLSRSHIAAL